VESLFHKFTLQNGDTNDKERERHVCENERGGHFILADFGKFENRLFYCEWRHLTGNCF
jgi:hypothetical protein